MRRALPTVRATPHADSIPNRQDRTKAAMDHTKTNVCGRP